MDKPPETNGQIEISLDNFLSASTTDASRWLNDPLTIVFKGLLLDALAAAKENHCRIKLDDKGIPGAIASQARIYTLQEIFDYINPE